MADGDARDRWNAEQRNASQRLAPDAPRGADARSARGRGPGQAGAPARRSATDAPRPVAPTRPLAPARAPAGRGAYAPQRGSRDTDEGADDFADDFADGRAISPASRAARPRAGWRRFMPILLGLGAGIALVALALGALILLTPRPAAPPAPSLTTQAFCADLTAQRYADAYALLSPRLQAQGSQAQFVASQRELDALQGDVTACSSAIVNVAGGSASASLQVTRAHTKSASAAVTLVAVGSSWRVDSYDTAVV